MDGPPIHLHGPADTPGKPAYFALCSTFSADDVVVLERTVLRTNAVTGRRVSISASVVEVFPDRFVMNARIRPDEGEAVAADLR